MASRHTGVRLSFSSGLGYHYAVPRIAGGTNDFAIAGQTVALDVGLGAAIRPDLFLTANVGLEAGDSDFTDDRGTDVRVALSVHRILLALDGYPTSNPHFHVLGGGGYADIRYATLTVENVQPSANVGAFQSALLRVGTGYDTHFSRSETWRYGVLALVDGAWGSASTGGAPRARLFAITPSIRLEFSYD